MAGSDTSEPREGSLRPQYSWDSGLSVPISDPNRAPAPLPLHPGRSSPVSNRITSPNVAAAHEALASKAREINQAQAPLPPRSPDKGLEKSLIRSAQRRMTNFENVRPSPLSPTRDRSSQYELRTPEQSPTRQGSEPNLRDILGDAPHLRPSRPASRAITGEPSPQSATMKALMARPSSSREERSDEESRSQVSTPKAFTSSCSAPTNGTPGQSQPYEGLASQILGLTSICTNLQHEMTQLTRRSKDNASDLLSLRDVANTRDEDIRNTLQELVVGLKPLNADGSKSPNVDGMLRARSTSPLPDFMSEPELSPKRATLPRIPSLKTFSASVDGRSRPNLNIDGAPALALLEKIHDEMATKLDISCLHDSIEDVAIVQANKIDSEKDVKDTPKRTPTIRSDPTVARKLEEIITIVKNGSANTDNVTKKLDELSDAVKDGVQSRALVPASQYRSISDTNGQLQQASDLDTPFSKFRGAQDKLAQINARSQQKDGLVTSPDLSVAEPVITSEMMKILKRVNNSVFESGGLTSEIKMLLRDMRGEVLGMGRNITNKLEKLESAKSDITSSEISTSDRGASSTLNSDEVADIVQESFGELKKHFDRLHKEYRRSSNSSVVSRSTVDVDQIEAVVTGQLKQLPATVQATIHERFEDVKELVADAIKENWESFKPELSIEMDGLQKEEIIETIKDCLKDSQFRSRGDQGTIGGATYDEVVEAVQQAMENFKMPPAPASELPFDKDEILAEMREEMQATVSRCFEEFEFPTPTYGDNQIATRSMDLGNGEFLEVVRDEVREGMAQRNKTETMINIAEEDLVNAVRIGLQEMPMGQINTEVLDRCQSLIDEMKAEFKQYSSANGRDTEQVLDALSDNHANLVEIFKGSMDNLRGDIESYVDRSQDVTGKDEIIESVRSGVDQVRSEMETLIANIPQSSASLNNTSEILEGMEKEFEHLRITLTNVVRADSTTPGGREEILDAIHEGFQGMKHSLPKTLPFGSASEMSSATYDADRISEVLAGILEKSENDITKEEMIVLVREAVEEVGAKSVKNGGASSFDSEEILNTFNEAFDSLDAKFEKISKRTQDSNNITYDVLETLKSGIMDVRADIERLAGAQKEQSGGESATRGDAVIVADPEAAAKTLEKNDIEKLEVMIGQLKTQVDGIPTASPPSATRGAEPEPSTDPALRSELRKIQDMMLELQVSIESVAAKASAPANNAATKEDTDALETILLNTKAMMEETKLPSGVATEKGIEELHEMLQNIRDVVDDFSMRSEAEMASKQDILLVEALAKEIHASIDGIKTSTGESQLSKDDIGGIELLCDDMKQKLDQISSDAEPLTTRSDMEALSEIMKEFQDKFETEIAEVITALGSRKTEHGEMTDKIEEIRVFVETVRDELKSQLESRKEEIENINLSVTTIGEKISGDNSGEKNTTTKELHETFSREFERAHGDREEMKLGLEQHKDELLQKHEEHCGAVITELGSKIDMKFDELITRYEDAMLAADGKATTWEDASKQQAEAVEEARAVAEELKISIDALVPTLTKACDEMVIDSKAAFSQVSGFGERMEEGVAMLSSEAKLEHAGTRADIAKAQATLENIQSHAEEYSPKILAAIADVLERVSQQHEEARKSAEEIKSSVGEIPSSFPALPAPSSDIERALPEGGKYDDAEVQMKLDQLIELSSQAGKASAQNEVLEQIKAQVASTAAGLEAFVRSQQAFNERQDTAAIEASESKTREVEETNLILEKRIAHKEAVEADIIRLMEEKSNLSENVEDLMRQEKEYGNLKVKMQADLRGLETALQIRREEMYLMEKRAHDLHNHILNSVIDSSRAALKSTKSKGTAKEMANPKRVPSDASNTTVTTKVSTAAPRKGPSSAAPSAASQGLSMALKKRSSVSRSGASTPSGGRRILSLSTISANKAAADKALVASNPVLASTNMAKSHGNNLKRSHSVKSNFPTRKTSWGGSRQPGLYADSVLEEDKENSIYEDEEELDGQDASVRDSVGYSHHEHGRSSYAGTYDGTASYTTESHAAEAEDDEYDDDDVRSFVSSSLANVGYKDSEQGVGDRAREGADDEEMVDDDPAAWALAERKPGIFIPADSGLGTDCPSAPLTAPSEFLPDD